MDSRTEQLYHVCRKMLLQELRQRYQHEYLADGKSGEDGLGFGDDAKKTFTNRELSVLKKVTTQHIVNPYLYEKLVVLHFGSILLNDSKNKTRCCSRGTQLKELSDYDEMIVVEKGPKNCGPLYYYPLPDNPERKNINGYTDGKTYWKKESPRYLHLEHPNMTRAGGMR